MKDKKKKFVEPVAEVIDFTNDDIITGSGDTPEGFLKDGETEEW